MDKRTVAKWGLMRMFLDRAVKGLYGLFAPPPGPRPLATRHFSRLLQLEERALPSVAPVGVEYRVNTYTQGAQQTFPDTPQAVAVNPTNGNYVVVWSSKGQNGGGGYDVYFQQYTAAGVPQGLETLVDIPVNGVNQQYANVAMNSSGNFVVTWSSNGGGHWNIYAQQYNASGVAQGLAIPVDTPTSADQEYSTVALNDAGDFLIAWSSHVSGTWQIYANAFNQNGISLANGFVTNATADQMYPDVALNDANTVVITWSGHQASHWNVYAEMFTSLNQPDGGIFQVNTNMTDDQEYSAVAMDANSNFTITWSGHQNGHWNIYAQSYFADGTANGSNFQVNPTTGQDQENSSIAFTGSSDPIITWSSNNQDGSGWGVYAQQVTPTGIPLGSEFQVNTTWQDNQFNSSVAGAPNGDIVIVWSSNNQDGSNLGVYGQNFVTSASSASINLTGNTFLVAEDNNVVLLNASTGTVEATYATGVANDGSVIGPDGSIYVADYYANTILHFSAMGTVLPTFGSGYLSEPQGLTFGPNGNLYVTNANNTIQEFSPTGTFLGTFISATGNLNDPKAIVWGPDSNAYVSNYANSEITEYNGTTGAYIGVFATGTGGGEDLTFGPGNNLYVASYDNNAVYLYNGTTGASMGTFISGSNLSNPYSLRFDAAGNLDVSNRTSGEIQTFKGTTGAFVGTLASGLTEPAYLSSVNYSVYGQPETFTATLSAVAPAAATPTGTVLFMDGTTILGTATLSGGTATFTTSTPGVTANTITAIYEGDTTYASSISSSMYEIVNPSTLTVSAGTSTIIYGQANPVFTYTLTGFVNGDTSAVVSGSPGLTTTATATSPVGNYTITAALGSLSAANYIFVFSNNTLTVTPATLLVTATNASKTYGQTLAFAGTEFTTSGLVNSDEVDSVMLNSAGAVATATVAGSPYGIVASTATGTGLGNYNINYVNGNLTVNPAPLTITANSVNKTYGQALAFAGTEFTTSGLVNSDTVDSVTLNSSGAVATATVAGGPYAIAASAAAGMGLGNYSISYANGSLTVNPAGLTVTANSATKTYGQTLAFAGTEFTTSGLLNSDTVASVTLNSAGAAATATVGGGPYTITASAATGTGLGNYSISYVNGNLAVNPAALTVTANSATKTYGQTLAFAGTEFTTSGLVNTDTVASVTLNSAGTAATATVVGSPYTITASAATGMGLGNYSISYVNGSFSVNPATLTVTANSATKTYGQTLVFAGTEFTTSGLVNSDTVANLTLNSAGAVATATVGGGPYAITLNAASGAGLDNYIISYVNGSLTVNPAALIITANSVSKIYGQTLVFAGTEFTTSGQVNSNTVASVTLNSAGAAPTATVAGGPYAITASAATGTGLGNYNISYVNGTLIVDHADLTVTAISVSKIYGQTLDFADTEFTTTGLANIDAVASVTLNSAGGVATATVAGGPYAITASAATGTGLDNYNIIYVNGNLTVNKATLTGTANDATKFYGQNNPVFLDTFTGFVNGDTASVLSGTASLTTTTVASSPIGSYTISIGLGSLSAANYKFTFVNGTLTVNPLSPVANNDSYSTPANMPLTVTAASLLSNDTDPQARPLTASFLSGPSNGTLAVGDNGSFTYIPHANFVGMDSFNYKVTDGLVSSNVASVTLRVTGILVTPTSSSGTSEANGSETLTIVLGVQPTATVMISLSSSVLGLETFSSQYLTFTRTNWNLAQTVTATSTNSSLVSNVPNYGVKLTAISADSGYAGLTSLVELNNKVAVAESSATHLAISSVDTQPSATSINPVFLIKSLPPSTTTAAASGFGSFAVSASSDSNMNRVVSSSAKVVNPSSGSSIGLSSAGSSQASNLLNLQRLISQTESPTDDRPSAGRIRGSSSNTGSSVTESPSDDLEFSPASRATALNRGRGINPFTPLLWNSTEENLEQKGELALAEEVRDIALTGVLAGAGYLLLNTRPGFWLLSLLTARPLWNDLDPLEILYTWEQEQESPESGAKGKEKETLLSLVE